MDSHFVKWVIILTITIYLDAEIVWAIIFGSLSKLVPELLTHLQHFWAPGSALILIWVLHLHGSHAHRPLSPSQSLFWNLCLRVMDSFAWELWLIGMGVGSSTWSEGPGLLVPMGRDLAKWVHGYQLCRNQLLWKLSDSRLFFPKKGVVCCRRLFCSELLSPNHSGMS